MTVAPSLFRQVLGSFATGVTVVTVAAADGGTHGMTANAFMSVSLDPPLVAVAVRSDAHLLRTLTEGFGITVLADGQEREARRFAGMPVAAHEPAAVFDDRAGVPVLAGGLAWLACGVHDVVPAGDHELLLGEVHDLGLGGGYDSPLAFFRSGFSRLTPAPDHGIPPELWSGGLDVWG